MRHVVPAPSEPSSIDRHAWPRYKQHPTRYDEFETETSYARASLRACSCAQARNCKHGFQRQQRDGSVTSAIPIWPAVRIYINAAWRARTCAIRRNNCCVFAVIPTHILILVRTVRALFDGRAAVFTQNIVEFVRVGTITVGREYEWNKR